MLQGGHELLVVPERGYAMLRGRQIRLVAAFDDDGARTVLRAALARVAGRGESAHLEFLTVRQHWAIDACVEARLDLQADCGACSCAATSARSRPTSRAGRTCSA